MRTFGSQVGSPVATEDGGEERGGGGEGWREKGNEANNFSDAIVLLIQ